MTDEETQRTLNLWRSRAPLEPIYRISRHQGFSTLDLQTPTGWEEVDRIDEPPWYRLPHGTLLWLCGLRQHVLFGTGVP
jgi:hypothetical protein